jgi:sulfite reductase alpha subunit-like flavoprotein
VKQGATGSNTLFFGCRFSNRDFLYKDELEQLVNEKKLDLHTAFSREQKQKVYVQNKVAEAAAKIWTLLEVRIV